VNDEEAPSQPEAEQPEAEDQSAPEASAEEQPEAEQPAEEQPESEQRREQPEPEEATEEQAESQVAEEPEPAGADAEDSPAGGDVVPGAELEPIAIEPERELSAEERARLEAEAEERERREAEATAEGEEPVARRGPQVELPSDARIQATGKRKSSIARVVLCAGSGGFEVNRRPLDEYFPRPYLRSIARQPLLTAGYEDAVDVQVRVHGGGVAGQAGAVRHGVARALTEIDPELRPELKRRGLLTRDARRKERRKAGLKKARKRPQFSKR
jgi:small subunit ribosomal protein S9